MVGATPNDDSRIRLKATVKIMKNILCENHENKGYGAGNNIGILREAKTRNGFILIANPDTDLKNE